MPETGCETSKTSENGKNPGIEAEIPNFLCQVRTTSKAKERAAIPANLAASRLLPIRARRSDPSTPGPSALNVSLPATVFERIGYKMGLQNLKLVQPQRLSARSRTGKPCGMGRNQRSGDL